MEGASVGFVLKPRYYQTAWFDCLCVLLLVFMIFLAFRFNTRRLRARAQELTRVVEERTKALQFQATHDSMTTFLNRRAILESMAAELSRSKREKTPLAVMMADLDHFKDVNDTYGHVAGDQVLCEIARRLLESVRPYDFVGRYGGEEFLIVLSNCNSVRAIERGEELLRTVAATPVLITSGTIQVTMSIGMLAVEHWESTSPERPAAVPANGQSGRLYQQRDRRPIPRAASHPVRHDCVRHPADQFGSRCLEYSPALHWGVSGGFSRPDQANGGPKSPGCHAASWLQAFRFDRQIGRA